MLIGGLQKTSLMDYPDKISTIIFTPGCNFRCCYCHNPHLIENPEAVISEEKVFAFLKEREKFIDAVVISGGEPTIQKDLVNFIKRVREMGFLVKLDTNGAKPDVIEELIKNRLIDYIAMDIKGPLSRYKEITETDVDTEKIKKSIELIMSSGIDYEFRTTAYPKLSIDDFREMLEMIKGAKRFFIQQYEPKTTLKKEKLKPLEEKTLYEILDIAKQYVQQAGLRNVRNERI